MTTVIFFENKFKTKFWQKIASELISKGIDVHWIVQNPLFKPSAKKIHYVPPPPRSSLRVGGFEKLEKQDRHCYIYGNKPNHYHYYKQEIKKVIKKIDPSLVFGEATLFHELLGIDICRELGILYLHPTTSRYPNGRFIFTKYDTLETFAGSRDSVPLSQLKLIIAKIKERKVSPDYMIRSKMSRNVQRYFIKVYAAGLNFLASEFFGEKYNTPKLIEKLRVEIKRAILFRRYEVLAHQYFSNFKRDNTLVFPLQMQPESNIDVWGYPFNDQVMLLSELSERLGEEWTILVKPNPKSKYEISERLISMVESAANIVALSHDTKMEELLDSFDYFFSVTGTINLECILSNKVCFSPRFLVTGEFFPGQKKIPVRADFPVERSEHDNKAELLMRRLIAESYRGVISDPISSPECLDESNIASVSDAFMDVIHVAQQNNR